MKKLDLRTARDVIFFFPRDYQDMSELRPIERLVGGEPLSVTGIVEEIELRGSGPGRSILGVLVRQGTHYLRAVWFNQPFMQQRFAVGQRVLLSGRAKQRGMRWEMPHPRAEILDDEEEPSAGSIMPIYRLTEGVGQPAMRRIVHKAVENYQDCLHEVFPLDYLESHQLAGIHDALREIHFPSNRSALEFARRRFIYQELLVMQLGLMLRRENLEDCRATPLEASAKIDARIRRLFPFELTDDQGRAIQEIAEDMRSERPMNRLLQGDVGSGKTVVAQYAMLLAVAHGSQAVLMAPTEVLARQHARTFEKSLQQSRARIGLLTGSLTASQRREMLKSIAGGETNLLIGTQAVLNEKVQFNRLGVVVIDEQHKFGVRQRASLRQAGLDPHYLVMTATPIPRTIAMTLFGDLVVSTLRNGPPGRQSVHTYLGSSERRERWWNFFCKKLREGRQGYIITPLVDESSLLPMASVEASYEELANGPLESFRLDLVHGQMSSDAKDEAMAAFHSGKTQVLVATSVVEVGVDVPNATIMTIENGERFGLAQLHQLRGRISRGPYPGYLCVFSSEPSPEAAERLGAFSKSTDGFELAETDFRLRGPGDLFGLRQHGLPSLRIANLVRDAEMVMEARSDAERLISTHPKLQEPTLERLRHMVLVRYGQALELGDVG
jgi:ATP-dependent DNA helicase RecG